MPHKARLAISKAEVVIGVWVVVLLISRRSWEWEKWWIREPAQIKSRALNMAWVIKWKKVRFCSPKAKVDSITPSWLSVDRAMIFFRSHSTMADIPAISIVREEIKRREGEKRE